MLQWAVLTVQGGIYQSSLAGSVDTNFLISQMISEIPPVVSSNMRLGVSPLHFKDGYAWVKLYRYALVWMSSSYDLWEADGYRVSILWLTC